MNAQQQSKQNGRLRVLIADDVVETRRSMRLMMTQVPDTVVVAIAHNGRQAITLTDKEKPDIAFVDVNMPELDGLELCRRIKNMPETEDIPVHEAETSFWDKLKGAVTGS